MPTWGDNMLNLGWLYLSVAMAGTSGDWQTALDAHRAPSGRVNYGAIHREGSLDNWLQSLERAAEPSERNARMAFWINAYNALTVDLVADHYPLASIRDLDNGEVWKTRRFTVANRKITLDEIEHQILRPLGDPRIHFALNCAAISCPTLRAQAFVGVSLNAQLERASREWIATQGIQIDRAAKRLQMAKIFEWYAADFSPGASALIPGVEAQHQGMIQFVANHVTDSDAQWIRAGSYQVSFLDYDWRVNGTEH